MNKRIGEKTVGALGEHRLGAVCTTTSTENEVFS